jgi:predicted GH43/DUF377 family glycosyl hydrolase
VQKSASRCLPNWDRQCAFILGGLLVIAQLVLLGLVQMNEDWPDGWVWLPLLAWVCNAANLLIVKRPFRAYDRILSAHSNDGVNWFKESGIRLDVGGQHASRQVYSPCVVKAEEGWRMFYRGGGNNSVILSAFSCNGINWCEEAGVRVKAGGSWSLKRVDFPCVVMRQPGTWSMYYAASDGDHWRIFMRNSRDQLRWEDERLALELVGVADLLDAFDPCIVFCDDHWRMYFTVTGFGAAENSFYFSDSSDGNAWSTPVECRGLTLEQHCIRNAFVIRLADGRWRMYFSQYGKSIIGSSIVSAVSLDGVEWQRELGVRLSPGGTYDPHGAFCPQVVSTDDGWRMYYGGYWGHHWLEWFTLWRHRRHSLTGQVLDCTDKE